MLVPTESKYSDCSPWLEASRHWKSPFIAVPLRSSPSQMTVCCPAAKGLPLIKLRTCRPCAS